MKDIQKLCDSVLTKFPESGPVVLENTVPAGLRIEPTFIHPICEWLHADPDYYFDQLSCLTGLDNGADSGSMEVIYHLYSIPKHYSLTLKCVLPREDPIIDSVSNIWRTANWHEREAFDLLGIRFKDHPDLRRILLPSDWEGHPLRKDYQEQEKYHGMTVVYDRDDDNKPTEQTIDVKE